MHGPRPLCMDKVSRKMSNSWMPVSFHLKSDLKKNLPNPPYYFFSLLCLAWASKCVAQLILSAVIFSCESGTVDVAKFILWRFLSYSVIGGRSVDFFKKKKKSLSSIRMIGKMENVCGHVCYIIPHPHIFLLAYFVRDWRDVCGPVRFYSFSSLIAWSMKCVWTCVFLVFPQSHIIAWAVKYICIPLLFSFSYLIGWSMRMECGSCILVFLTLSLMREWWNAYQTFSSYFSLCI